MMSSNSTDQLSSANAQWEVFRHVIYVCEGLMSVVCNSLIVLTVTRHSALRFAKECVGLGASAAADALNSAGQMFAGLYRMSVWLNGTHLSPASSRFCLLKPHSMLWAFFLLSSKTMMVVLSLDRCLAVAIPLYYYSLTNSYMIRMTSVAFGMSFAFGAWIYVAQWPETQNVYTQICWSSAAFGMHLEYVRNVLVTACTLLSIAIYILVPIFYYHKQNSVAPEGTPQTAARAQMQRELNKSVAVSCLVTFVFVALPWFVSTLAGDGNMSREEYEAVDAWKLIVANVDPMVNLWVYYKKQRYFRKGYKALFENKTLPPVLDLW